MTKRKANKAKKANMGNQKQLTRLGAALRTLGGLGGGAVGGLIGQGQAGSSFGTSLGASISKWLGSGDYTVSRNSLLDQRASTSIPMMHREDQTVIVRHKEFLAQISSSVNFTVQQSFTLNPGMSNTFPWLSKIANAFQQYAVRGMVFHYIPTSGASVASTNPALGSVMMQTSYRANDNPPTSKSELLNEYWSSEARPSEPFCHPIECDPKENPFNVHYIRSAGPPDGDSVLMYDLGTTYVATSGNTGVGNVLGDLWVTYEVELKKPIIQSNVTADDLYAMILFTGGIYSVNNLFNSPGIPLNVGNLNISWDGTNGVIFPVGVTGVFLIEVTVGATTTFSAADATSTSSFINCENFPDPLLGNTYLRTVLGGGTPTLNRIFRREYVRITNDRVQAIYRMGAWTTITGTVSGVTLVVSKLY